MSQPSSVSSSSSISISKNKEQKQILSSTSSTQAASASPPSERHSRAFSDEHETAEKAARHDRRQAKLESDVVEAQFRSYLTLFGRDPARYTLTPKRKHHAMARLHERMKLRGSVAGAVDDFQVAMKHLHADEYMRSNKWSDWDAHLFKTAEEFEKRLNWATPENTRGGSNGRAGDANTQGHSGSNGSYQRFESADEQTERAANEAIRRIRDRYRKAAETDKHEATGEDTRT
jgi:hypothetical protein